MKPRIVLLSAFLSPFRSGAEACVEEVALRLCDRYDIVIVTAKLRRSFPREGLLQGRVRVLRVGLGLPSDKWLFPVFGALAARRLRPQLMHAVLESYAGLALLGARLLWRAPTLLTCQSTNTSFLVRFMHRFVTGVTCISRVLMKRAADFGRTDAVLIPNGVDTAAIRAAGTSCPKVPGRILFTGRLEQMKGVDTLLRAFAQVSAPNAHLHIVGDGSKRAELETLARALRLTERVTFRGFIAVPHVFEEFAAAEIFCGLSRSEALGNVFLEAQSAGCAVVATNVGGIPDVVQDGLTGMLVAPNNPAAAAHAMNTLLANESLRTSFRQAAQQNALRYDWHGVAAQYAAQYDRLLA